MKHNKTERQARIDEIRSMHMRNNYDNDPFDGIDKMLNSGAKGFAKLGAIALVVNLIFWLVIIAAVIFGLSLVF